MSQPNSELVILAQKPSVASQRAWDETTRPLHWHAGPTLAFPEGWVYSFPSNPQHRLFRLEAFPFFCAAVGSPLEYYFPYLLPYCPEETVRFKTHLLNCASGSDRNSSCLRAFMVGHKLWQGLHLLTMGFLALHTVLGHITEFDK